MKTVQLSDETHKQITEKIKELKNKYKVNVTIENLVDIILSDGIKIYEFTKR